MKIEKAVLSIKNLLILIVGILGLYILQSLSKILLPLVFALLLCIIYLPVVLFLRKRKIPTTLITSFVAVITIGVLYFVSNIFITTITEIIDQQDFLIVQFTKKSNSLIDLANNVKFIDINSEVVNENLQKIINPSRLTAAATSFVKGAGNFGSSILMFSLYFLFLLPGLSHYESYLNYVGGDDNKNLVTDYETIQKNISTYLGIKTVISLTTGTIAGLICQLMGLKFAFFWGFLTFIFNFIPSIGSIIATFVPALMGLILLDTFQESFVLLFLLGSVQMLIGNFIEPRIMGNRLRLNTVTVLFGLVFWGVIWGIPGMLMSLPLMVTIKLFLERSSTWSILARIMGYPEKEKKKKKEEPTLPFLEEKE